MEKRKATNNDNHESRDLLDIVVDMLITGVGRSVASHARALTYPLTYGPFKIEGPLYTVPWPITRK